MLNDVVIGRAAQARNKAGSARVVVRVPPIGVRAHSCLSNAEALLVQRRICIRQIEFCGSLVRGKPTAIESRPWRPKHVAYDDELLPKIDAIFHPTFPLTSIASIVSVALLACAA